MNAPSAAREPLVIRGRASPVPLAILAALTIGAAWAAEGHLGPAAALAAAGVALYGLCARSFFRFRGRRIRLEAEGITFESGRGSVAVAWDNLGRIWIGLGGELLVEILEPGDPARFLIRRRGPGGHPSELPELAGGALRILGRYEIPLSDLGDLVAFYRTESTSGT
ncbi:MAG: hypothetical protein HY720_04665 [Planctomycetes bacterium]|nr:hypothetical protein [Planctomycetota bacterium]